jgi:hypothetical protein
MTLSRATKAKVDRDEPPASEDVMPISETVEVARRVSKSRNSGSALLELLGPPRRALNT